jgi:hypothetical protein
MFHSTIVHSTLLLQYLRVCAARPTARADSYRGIRYRIAVVSAMVGPRPPATATWHRNRSDGAADETASLMRPRDSGWDEPTPKSGARAMYVTLRWLIAPSWSGTLGTSDWLSANALVSVPESGHTPRPGKRASQVCTRPITKYHLASSCYYCDGRVDAIKGPEFRLRPFYVGQSAECDLTNKIALPMSERKRSSSIGQTVRADDSPVLQPAVRVFRA